MPDGRGRRVAVVSARFYAKIADWLESGAVMALVECGVAPADIALWRVPGAFELPLAAQRAFERGYDAVVALGTVIRGETAHFEYVAGECSRGLMVVQLRAGKAVGFGVLTTENAAQAEERADPERGNKGRGAALAVLSVLGL